MFSLDDSANKNNEYHNSKLLYIPDHPHGMLITGVSGSGKKMSR